MASLLPKLVPTYQGLPDLDWWRNIITDKTFGGCAGPVVRIDGWFIKQMLAQYYEEASSGLVAVALNIRYSRQ